MRKRIPNWNLLAVVLGTSAFLAAFGVALAATVQVSRQVGTNFTLIESEVISGENLGLFTDVEGEEPLTVLNFEVVKLQPPLSFSGAARSTVYIRNESEIDLTLIEPCHLNSGPLKINGVDVGNMDARLSTLEGDDLDWLCNANLTLSPGEMVRAEVTIGDFHNKDLGDLSPGTYAFATVFGAIGEVEP